MENQNQGSVSQQFNQSNNNPQFGQQIPLPNATAVLVLGIISIVGCICYGVPGLICGIIALVMAGKAKKLLSDNPTMYLESSVKNMNAGRICAIIGTILSALYFLFFVVYLVIVGSVVSSMPWESMGRY